MSRRWFEMWNGLVLSAMFAATAWGQASQQQPSLAERMAALRRGWSGSEAPRKLLEWQPNRLAFRRKNRRRFGPILLAAAQRRRPDEPTLGKQAQALPCKRAAGVQHRPATKWALGQARRRREPPRCRAAAIPRKVVIEPTALRCPASAARHCRRLARRPTRLARWPVSMLRINRPSLSRDLRPPLHRRKG